MLSFWCWIWGKLKKNLNYLGPNLRQTNGNKLWSRYIYIYPWVRRYHLRGTASVWLLIDNHVDLFFRMLHLQHYSHQCGEWWKNYKGHTVISNQYYLLKQKTQSLRAVGSGLPKVTQNAPQATPLFLNIPQNTISPLNTPIAQSPSSDAHHNIFIYIYIL